MSKQNQRQYYVTNPQAVDRYFWLTLLPATNDSGFRYIGEMTFVEALATHRQNDFVLATLDDVNEIWRILNHPDTQNCSIMFEVEGVELKPMATTRNWSFKALNMPATFEDEEDYERWQLKQSIFTHHLYIAVYDLDVAKRIFRVLTAEEVNPS